MAVDQFEGYVNIGSESMRTDDYLIRTLVLASQYCKMRCRLNANESYRKSVNSKDGNIQISAVPLYCCFKLPHIRPLTSGKSRGNPTKMESSVGAYGWPFIPAYCCAKNSTPI